MTRPATTTSVPGPRTSAAAAGTAQTGTARTGTAGTDRAPDRVEQVATVLVLPFTVVQSLLPRGPVPVALGASALAIGGVVEWPAAAAIGLGWLALRWGNRVRPPALRRG